MTRCVLQDPQLEQHLPVLHAKSDKQLEVMQRYYAERAKQPKTFDSEEAVRTRILVALDRNKAEFCYQLLRGIYARRVVPPTDSAP